MKHCPQCKRTYEDDSQRYCLDDGTILVAQAATLRFEDQPTLLLNQQPTVPPQPARTRASVERLPVERRRRWPILVGAAVFVLTILLVCGWWFSTRSADELLYQTRFDNPARMRALLALGADVNARDRGESTPLMGAAWRDQTEAVKILLANGAALNARNRSNETPLILAAKEGHTDIVRLLLDRNPDLNAKDSEGWTCLMWASWSGYSDTVKLLLSTSIKVEAQNNLGETAQSLAYKKNHPEIVSLLAKEAASP